MLSVRPCRFTNTSAQSHRLIMDFCTVRSRRIHHYQQKIILFLGLNIILEDPCDSYVKLLHKLYWTVPYQISYVKLLHKLYCTVPYQINLRHRKSSCEQRLSSRQFRFLRSYITYNSSWKETFLPPYGAWNYGKNIYFTARGPTPEQPEHPQLLSNFEILFSFYDNTIATVYAKMHDDFSKF